MLSREVIFEQILKLGIKNADLIFIAADLRRVGFFNKTRAETEEDWIYVFNSLLALEITIVIPSYTPTFLYFPPFFKGKSNSYFSSEISGTNSGSLSELILRNKSIFNFIRSDHPTNSLISIGPLAETILSGHDEFSTPYMPYKRIVDYGGKHLMLGCVRDLRLGPMSFHAAQSSLGLTKQHYLSGRLASYFLRDGFVKLYIRNEIGGCTAGTHKIYGHLLSANAIQLGKVGKDLSALIDNKISYKIFCDYLESDSSYFQCGNANCKDCYGSRAYNNLYLLFWIKYLFIVLKQRF